MSEKQVAILVAPAREGVSDRLSAVALFLAVLVVAAGLTHLTGVIEVPALDPATAVVGP